MRQSCGRDRVDLRSAGPSGEDHRRAKRGIGEADGAEVVVALGEFAEDGGGPTAVIAPDARLALGFAALEDDAEVSGA
jgi:hypothetical protein